MRKCAGANFSADTLYVNFERVVKVASTLFHQVDISHAD